ncbi:cell division topological specificity factor MinE, partial [Paracoccus litorisediminis]
MTMFGISFRPRKPNPAQTAKERLQILLAHERAGGTSPDFLPLLQRDILEVVRR